MELITLDMETYYDKEYSLSKMTMQEYILDPRFEVIGVSVKRRGHPAQWYSGTMQDTYDFLSEVDWDKTMMLCQNTMFDAAILAWHFNLHPKMLADTLCMSRALYPHQKSHSLAAQAKRHNKKEKGTEVLNAIGKRRLDFTAEELAKYGIYCDGDCEITEALAVEEYFPRMPVKELLLIDHTLRAYTKPALALDKFGLQEHLDMVQQDKANQLEEVREMLDPKATDEDLKYMLASSAKFAQVLQGFGIEPPMKVSPITGKSTYAFAKTDAAFKALEEHDDPRVQVLVAARLGEKSTIEETRTKRLLTCAELAPTVPIALRYYGAWTGRWSADSAGATNFQNMPRTSDIKRNIIAPEGYLIVGADLSNIELRLGLWLAGQWDKVDLIRNGLDLYKDLASKTNGVRYEDVPKDMRQTYKVVNLSAIYQTGGGRLKETLRIMAKQTVTLEAATDMIGAYRRDNPKVVAAWEDCRIALVAIANGDPVVPALFRGLVTWDWKVQGWLLPSGLHLQLPGLRTEMNEEGKPQFVFDGAHGPEKTYGGKLFQGLTQAIARCIISEGWLRIQKKHPIALSVHDSLYWLAKEAEAQQSLDWGIEQMTTPMDWCDTLPLGAEGGIGKTLLEV